MGARALAGSYLVFNLLMIALLWGDAWLPPVAGVAALVLVATGWSVAAFFLFRHLRLAGRQKVAGWLFLGVFVGFLVARRFSSYDLFHDAWLSWFVFLAATLLFVAISIGLAVFAFGGRRLFPAASFTVESVAPDHVLHVSSAPRDSRDRASACPDRSLTAGDR